MRQDRRRADFQLLPLYTMPVAQQDGLGHLQRAPMTGEEEQVAWTQRIHYPPRLVRKASGEELQTAGVADLLLAGASDLQRVVASDPLLAVASGLLWTGVSDPSLWEVTAAVGARRAELQESKTARVWLDAQGHLGIVKMCPPPVSLHQKLRKLRQQKKNRARLQDIVAEWHKTFGRLEASLRSALRRLECDE